MDFYALADQDPENLRFRKIPLGSKKLSRELKVPLCGMTCVHDFDTRRLFLHPSPKV